MPNRNAIALIALTALTAAPNGAIGGARAQDLSKYPDWSGQWLRVGGIQWDPSKPLGRAQQPPLTPEYQAIFDASLADQSTGGQGNNARFTCIPHGMPRAMTATFPFEILIMPKTTYILFENQPDRRIYTDGRDWPQNLEPAFAGYSIGHWDQSPDGRFDLLEVETRNMKGPRDFETSGLPVTSTRCIIAAGHGATIAAFAGTDPLAVGNWITNFNLGPRARELHRGFESAVAAVWPQICAALSERAARPLSAASAAVMAFVGQAASL